MRYISYESTKKHQLKSTQSHAYAQFRNYMQNPQFWFDLKHNWYNNLKRSLSTSVPTFLELYLRVWSVGSSRDKRITSFPPICSKPQKWRMKEMMNSDMGSDLKVIWCCFLCVDGGLLKISLDISRLSSPSLSRTFMRCGLNYGDKKV